MRDARITLRLQAVASNAESTARLAQSAERKALNLVVVGLSPTVGVLFARSTCALAELAGVFGVFSWVRGACTQAVSIQGPGGDEPSALCTGKQGL